jgi:cytosine deaminase
MDAVFHDARLPRVGVPRALLARPESFGGTAQGDLLCGTLVVQGGVVRGLTPETGAPRPTRVLLPKLAEAHIHLDKCHSIERIPDVGGDLAAALAAQMQDKALWTEDDLTRRARRGVDELIAAGVGAARSHVDWGTAAGEPDQPVAWGVLHDLKRYALERGLILQSAALTGIDEMADPTRAESVARIVARDGGAFGSFALNHADKRIGLLTMFRLAELFGLPLDFHVDEGLAPSLTGLELIADVALETGFQGPILCGHACSLASHDLEDVARIAEKLARARIAVAVLPTTNLYLQGRIANGTPDRRGVTRLHELAARGVEIVVATDNVRDAFCPIGRHDPMHSLAVGVMAGHLDPPYGRHMATITTHARRAMGLPALTIDGAAAGDLILFDAPSLSGVIAGALPPISLNDQLEKTDA